MKQLFSLALLPLALLSGCTKATIKGGWEGSGYQLVCRDDAEAGNYTLRAPSGRVAAGKFELDKGNSDDKAVRYRLSNEGSYDTMTLLINRATPKEATLMVFSGGVGEIALQRASIKESGSTAPSITARQFVEAYLKEKNYNIMDLSKVGQPAGFPSGENIDYFEAAGAFAGKKPQTVQIAVAADGSSFNVVKYRVVR